MFVAAPVGAVGDAVHVLLVDTHFTFIGVAVEGLFDAVLVDLLFFDDTFVAVPFNDRHVAVGVGREDFAPCLAEFFFVLFGATVPPSANAHNDGARHEQCQSSF